MTGFVSTQHATREWPGTGIVLLDRYHLVEYVATGSAAAVWRAHDAQLSRDVAVKLLLPHRLHDRVAQARFRAEALAASRAAHPNAVRIFDACTDETYTFIVMELVQGVSLADFDGDALEPMVVAALGAQVAGALAAAHDHALVHRDVKPANILIDASGRVKVADFGIAKALDADADLTVAEFTLGTARYLTPEQLTEDEIGPWTDVYALGLVLWEALTGRQAFAGNTLHATALARLQRELPPVRTVAPNVDVALERLIVQATRSDPAARQRHARDLATDLRAVCGPRPHELTRTLVS
jgi:serine/threonine-protein kinase